MTAVPAVVLVRWTTSNEFAPLGKERREASGDGVQAVVRAAVSGLLVQLGHAVTEQAGGGDLLVLATVQ
ncbi:hypothetical protein ABTZ58_36070 [Streptomyces sp. NPDC094143]|uniref:hypothetical protein n=1 Tax=Streptomyces sp. NPDC094143 TaxID=3155310 RepID=UPI003316A405